MNIKQYLKKVKKKLTTATATEESPNNNVIKNMSEKELSEMYGDIVYKDDKIELRGKEDINRNFDIELLTTDSFKSRRNPDFNGIKHSFTFTKFEGDNEPVSLKRTDIYGQKFIYEDRGQGGFAPHYEVTEPRLWSNYYINEKEVYDSPETRVRIDEIFSKYVPEYEKKVTGEVLKQEFDTLVEKAHKENELAKQRANKQRQRENEQRQKAIMTKYNENLKGF